MKALSRTVRGNPGHAQLMRTELICDSSRKGAEVWDSAFQAFMCRRLFCPFLFSCFIYTPASSVIFGVFAHVESEGGPSILAGLLHANYC